MNKPLSVFLLVLCCASPLAAQRNAQSLSAHAGGTIYNKLFTSQQRARQETYKKQYAAWISFLKNTRAIAPAVKENKRAAVLDRLISMRSLPGFMRGFTARENELLEVRRGLRPAEQKDLETFKKELCAINRLERKIKHAALTAYNGLQRELDNNPLMSSFVLSPEPEILFSRTRYAVNAPGARREYATAAETARRLFAVQMLPDGMPYNNPVYPESIVISGKRAMLTFRPRTSGNHPPHNLVFIFDATQGFVFARLIPR